MYTKHVSPQLAWDEVVYIASAAYNFVPNEQSEESEFFLMIGRSAYMPLVQLLHPQINYMDDSRSLLALEVIRDNYAFAIQTLNYLEKEKKISFSHILSPNFMLETKC